MGLLCTDNDKYVRQIFRIRWLRSLMSPSSKFLRETWFKVLLRGIQITVDMIQYTVSPGSYSYGFLIPC